MRIGYLVQQFPPEVGAGPARIGEMVKRWQQIPDVDVTVFTAMPNRPQGRIHAQYRGKLFVEERWEGVRVARSWLFARPGGGFATTLLNNASFAATSMLSAMRGYGPFDVLVASSPPYFPVLAGRILAAAWNVPLVIELRDLWPEYLVEMDVLPAGVGRAVLGMDAWLTRSAAHVVTVTEPLHEVIVRKGIEADRVTVISNGVDPALYFPAVEEPPVSAAARVPDGFLVGYLGNFGAGQGLDVVLDAAAMLARTAPKIRFLMVGEGTEFGKISARAAGLALPNLTILPQIAKESTRAFYNSCDACLVPLSPLPIFAGARPSKMLEMMATATPVIASAAGEVPRILAESGGGVFAPPGDASALAQVIEKLAKLPPEQRKEMGQRGREYVLRHFDRDALSSRYLELLRRVAGGQ